MSASNDQWEQIAPNTVLVFDEEDAVRVDLRVEGGPFEIVEEQIKEDVRVEGYPTRIGINLKECVKQAVIAATITVAER